jgi:hypothetical protein
MALERSRLTDDWAPCAKLIQVIAGGGQEFSAKAHFSLNALFFVLNP